MTRFLVSQKAFGATTGEILCPITESSRLWVTSSFQQPIDGAGTILFGSSLHNENESKALLAEKYDDIPGDWARRDERRLK